MNIFKRTAISIAASLVLVTSVLVHAEETQQKARYFAFVSYAHVTYSPKEFIVKVTDEKIADQLRSILDASKPQPPIAFSAKIEKGWTDYNDQWPFHVIPDTITFPFSTTEVCDASPEEIVDHLDAIGGAFLPNNEWCPWTMRVTREVKR